MCHQAHHGTTKDTKQGSPTLSDETVAATRALGDLTMQPALPPLGATIASSVAILGDALVVKASPPITEPLEGAVGQ